MTTAEWKAWEAYPQKIYDGDDVNLMARKHFAEGYAKAEGDNALDWVAAKAIVNIANDILRECEDKGVLPSDIYPTEADYYEEIIRRYAL
jgi:hypothetical protein